MFTILRCLSARVTQFMFYSLKNLVVLGLSQNKIEELPDEICQLSNLEELYLQCNAISTYDQHAMNDGCYM